MYCCYEKESNLKVRARPYTGSAMLRILSLQILILCGFISHFSGSYVKVHVSTALHIPLRPLGLYSHFRDNWNTQANFLLPLWLLANWTFRPDSPTAPVRTWQAEYHYSITAKMGRLGEHVAAGRVWGR